MLSSSSLVFCSPGAIIFQNLDRDKDVSSWFFVVGNKNFIFKTSTQKVKVFPNMETHFHCHENERKTLDVLVQLVSIIIIWSRFWRVVQSTQFVKSMLRKKTRGGNHFFAALAARGKHLRHDIMKLKECWINLINMLMNQYFKCITSSGAELNCYQH